MKNTNLYPKDGYFGKYGGVILPPHLVTEMKKISDFYLKIRDDKSFLDKLKYIRKHYQGRPTPISYAKNLSKEFDFADIYLKREDLNHTGAHKLNHCMGQVLLAKMMGKKKIIAETGAGQHGVALATASAYFGLECEIHMGEIDIKKEAPNVIRMKLLGAKVIPVSFGTKTLKDAVDSAFKTYAENPNDVFFAIGSVVGPSPYPLMVKDLQKIIGDEAEKQFKEMTGEDPNHVIACVGGGSNAIGIFQGFLENENVKLYGIEPSGRSLNLGDHAATLSFGEDGEIHGFKTILLKDKDGKPAPVYSIASGLDYPGVGPEHAYLKQIGRVNYKMISDKECLNAFHFLSKKEGIIPALESAHAVAYALKLAKTFKKKQTILVNLSGRGDKDIDFVFQNHNNK